MSKSSLGSELAGWLDPNSCGVKSRKKLRKVWKVKVWHVFSLPWGF